MIRDIRSMPIGYEDVDLEGLLKAVEERIKHEKELMTDNSNGFENKELLFLKQYQERLKTRIEENSKLDAKINEKLRPRKHCSIL